MSSLSAGQTTESMKVKKGETSEIAVILNSNTTCQMQFVQQWQRWSKSVEAKKHHGAPSKPLWSLEDSRVQYWKKNGYCKSTINCIRSCEVIKDEPQRPEFESLSSKCPCGRSTHPAHVCTQMTACFKLSHCKAFRLWLWFLWSQGRSTYDVTK